MQSDQTASNKSVVIVTGSGTGIGAACALDLAKRGCRVVINYTKSEAEARATAKQCEAAGAEVIVVQANVAVDADCQKMAQATLDKWGRIDGLVNNAGITKFVPNHRDLAGLTAEDFHNIYAVNVIGSFQMIRAVAPAMQKQGKGAVVNVASIAGVVGNGSSVAYAASKGALNTMTLSLARALAPEIRVNAVCPGFVETRWLQQGFGEKTYANAKANYEATVPLRHTISPEAVSDAIVWLLMGASLTTGEFILVDSGFHLGTAPLKAR
jgi:3-oxoacyl-[acyl-carrier protein] reductase